MEKLFIRFEDGKAILCSEADAEAVVTGSAETALKFEVTQWWSGEGLCRLTVNSFPLSTSLRIFGEMVKAFEKAESEGETKGEML